MQVEMLLFESCVSEFIVVNLLTNFMQSRGEFGYGSVGYSQDTNIRSPLCKRRCIDKQPFIHTLVCYHGHNRSMDTARFADSVEILLVASELDGKARFVGM